MSRKLASIFLAAALGFAAVGCSGEGGTGSSLPDDTNDLNSEFGGYTAADESPAFGDPELAAAMSAEPTFDDVLYPAIALDSLVDGKRDIYALMLRWGQLEGDSASTTPTDWSGSLELTYGGIVVRNLIRFEQGQDYIVRPRTSRTLLEWVSVTTVHYDGILVLVVDPPVDPDSVPGPNQLVLTLPGYTRTFTMEELSSLAEIVDIDAAGNQLAINARSLDHTLCGEGPMDGIWRFNPSGRGGEFFGRWMTSDGIFGGHVRGHFGVRSDSSRVFFGKAIGVDGRFAGLIRGTWGVDPIDPATGWFEGDWASRTGLAVGTVKGTWQSKASDGIGDDDNERPGRGRGRGPRWGGGFFTGWWERVCE